MSLLHLKSSNISTLIFFPLLWLNCSFYGMFSSVSLTAWLWSFVLHFCSMWTTSVSCCCAQCKFLPKYMVSQIAAKSLFPAGKVRRTDEHQVNLSRLLNTLNLIFHWSNKEDLKICKMYCIIKVVFQNSAGKSQYSWLNYFALNFSRLSFYQFWNMDTNWDVILNVKDKVSSKQAYSSNEIGSYKFFTWYHYNLIQLLPYVQSFCYGKLLHIWSCTSNPPPTKTINILSREVTQLKRF